MTDTNFPTPKNINDALESIAAAERPVDHPRRLAREAIAQWRSNAQREGLPITNLTHSGAPLLERDRVLRASYPTYGPVVAKRSLWAKLFRREQ